MTGEAMQIAQAQLRPGERLLWAGKPRALPLAMSRLGIFLFAIPFLAFSLFWLAMAQSFSGIGGAAMPNDGGFFDGSRFWLFGVPFVLVGLGMVLWMPLAFFQAPYMTYGVTDQRVFIAASFPFRSVQSWGPADINHLELRESSDGSGTLWFARSVSRTRGRRGSSTQTTYRGFYGIPGVRQVEALVARLRDGR